MHVYINGIEFCTMVELNTFPFSQFIWSWFRFLSMESYPSKMNHGTESNEKRDDGADPETHNKYKEIIATLPRSNRRHWIVDLYQYEGFWFPLWPLEGLLLAQDYFKLQPNDVILSSLPKSGTTWLKVLSFAILTRSSFDESASPLLRTFSYDCVPFLELEIWSNPQIKFQSKYYTCGYTYFLHFLTKIYNKFWL